MNKPLPFKMAQESELEKWRADTFWTKEPETIAWIDDFGPGQFWDVGANVGIYSLYACARHWKKVHVHAFEPHYFNFLALEQNVLANGFQREITPAIIALGDRTGFHYFYLSDAGRGASGGQVEMPVDERGNEFAVKDVYLIGTMTGDDLASQTGVPQYIKIDVDGREEDILRGMGRVLQSAQLRSVLIEVNRNRQRVVEAFRTFGFTDENKYNRMTPHSSQRRQREGIRAENIVFTRGGD